jgi:two-component sensor histidine kinase
VEKGVLRVEIVLVSQQIEVMIQDNGGGSVEEINQKSNLGMRLIRILSEQLGAHYDLQQKGGIKHLITFNI